MMLRSPDRSNSQQFAVEFSLALNNKTGKYFIGRDLIANLGSAVAEVRYWRMSHQHTPQGLYARILGRLMTLEVGARANHGLAARLIPKMKADRPVIFTDPLQVLLYELKPEDTIIVHDMGPLTHPRCYSARVPALYEKIFKVIARIKPRLLFVSRSSRDEFERLYGFSFPKTHVTYPGLRIEVFDGTTQRVDGVKPPFFLTVGAIGTRKNQASVIEALKTSGLIGRGYSYVICGSREPGFERVSSLSDQFDWVQRLGYVSEPQLRWLYANAEGFLLPSLLEGFGVPAAEAIIRGLVPLVSKGGALHEITGDSAILVDPTSVSSISQGLVELAGLGPDEKQARLAAMQEHLKFFDRENARKEWLKAVLNSDRVSAQAIR